MRNGAVIDGEDGPAIHAEQSCGVICNECTLTSSAVAVLAENAATVVLNNLDYPGAMAPQTMTIGGEPVAATATFPVIDPSLGVPFAEAPECSAAQMERALSAAQMAFAGWRQDVDARRTALHRAVEVIRGSADALAEIVTREQGKPLASAHGEVKAAVLESGEIPRAS